MLGLTTISGAPISSVGGSVNALVNYIGRTCFTVYLTARAMTVKLRRGISRFPKAGS